MEPKTKKDIEEYVLINHEYETAEELATNCGVELHKVTYILIKLKIKAISPTQAREEFARANYLKYSLDELAKIMDVAPSNGMLQELYANKKLMPQKDGLPVSRYKSLLEYALME